MTPPKGMLVSLCLTTILAALLTAGCGGTGRRTDEGVWLPTQREQRTMADRELRRLVEGLGKEMKLEDPERSLAGIVAQVERSRGDAVVIADDLARFARIHLERRMDGSVGSIRYDIQEKDFRRLFATYQVPEDRWETLAAGFNGTGSGSAEFDDRSFILEHDHATREWVYTLHNYPHDWHASEGKQP